MADTPQTIREAMTSAGVTQTALAERLGLTQPAVSARLAGRTPITVDELQIIADALGVEPADLLGRAA